MSHGSKKILPAVQAVLQHSNNGNNNEPSIPLPPNANFDENDNGTYHANLPTQHFSNVHPHPTHLNYIQQLQQQYFHQHQQLQLQHPSYVYPNITCGGSNLLLSSSLCCHHLNMIRINLPKQSSPKSNHPTILISMSTYHQLVHLN